MPQKRNPISSEVVLAASQILRLNASLVLDDMVADFERASGPWHLEWVAIPKSFVIAVAALHQMDFALSGLAVNADRMSENIHSTKGLIVGEVVMMHLGQSLGFQAAHDVVYEACKQSIEQGTTLYDELAGREEVTAKIRYKKLRNLCDPTNYMSACGLLVDNVLSKT